MNWFSVERSLEKLVDSVVIALPNIAVGFFILFVGRYVIKFVLKFIDSRFEKRNVDRSIRSFLKSIIKFTLYGLLLLTVASTMGIQTTSFIAALSAFGLAVGMALQGSLSNFAGGVLILLFRPFDVGDYISSGAGASGSVERIDLLYTSLIDDDGIRVFTPNGPLANSVIKNFTKIASRRMQFTLVVSYDTNIKVAREAVLTVLNNESRILDKPKAEVIVGDLKESGIQLIVRAWAKREEFWATKNDIAEAVKIVLDGKNVVFPQNVVKVIGNEDDAENTVA
ncbi:mechanosensitive ion channel [Sphingobacterium sp. DK4209]|uniref:Mechanosensitive ion channel n=1 Tax=Sphingobacterium zhuxiongii TaxID=2662364 RepID=A0A5Q0Q9L8_9SPHI|nr:MULTISPECIES: mechanosensitive ion channel domain-containing protein [unclassified Sphingobacterium]MVZ66842.1 mechanosensitive ion channel [Sphingobacterium sp. DK4209]QGA26233.1 mechanosensitive ion channel [Sphingobacterium sp. dk4302]